MAGNEKIKIKDVYDLVMPIKEDIATITQKIVNIDTAITETKDDNKAIKKLLGSKISIKAFITWLTSFSIIIGIVLAVIYR